MSWNKHLTKYVKKIVHFTLKYVLALTWEIRSDRLSRQISTYMDILMNHWILQKRLAVVVSKTVKGVINYTTFTLHAQNVCLQYERKHVDVGATSPSACPMNSMIQTVHSFLMHRLNSSTSEVLVPTEGGHFAHVV